MLHQPARVLVLALVAAGCGSPDITPKPGTWTYNDAIVTANTCTTAPKVPDGDFTLTALSEGRFTIEADGISNPLDCSHADNDFTCPETLLVKIDSEMFDAQLLVTVEVDGTLMSATEFSGTEVIRTSCNGADCEELIAASGQTVPCESTLSFTGVAK